MQPVRLLFKKYGAVYVLLVSKDDKHDMTSLTVCLLEDQGSKDKSQNVSVQECSLECPAVVSLGSNHLMNKTSHKVILVWHQEKGCTTLIKLIILKSV